MAVYEPTTNRHNGLKGPHETASARFSKSPESPMSTSSTRATRSTRAPDLMDGVETRKTW